MTVSIHDNHLVSYEVQCETRTITLRTEYRDREPTEYTNVVFGGVKGHHFQNDTFGNIISMCQTSPSSSFLENTALKYQSCTA
jgi:hypothetical protein